MSEWKICPGKFIASLSQNVLSNIFLVKKIFCQLRFRLVHGNAFFVYSVREAGVKYGKKVNIFDASGVNGWFTSTLAYSLSRALLNRHERLGFNSESYHPATPCCNDHSAPQKYSLGLLFTLFFPSTTKIVQSYMYHTDVRQACQKFIQSYL